MKICAISDLHGTLPKIEKCDILLIAGDITPHRFAEAWILKDFIKWINDLPCTHVIAVWGNHDFIGYNYPDIEKTLGKKTKQKIEFLNNETTTIYDDIGNSISIFGSPWCHIFGNWAFMISDNMLQVMYDKMPKTCDIVLTHDAPAIGDIGVITQGRHAGENAGNKVLAEIIKSRNVKYSISGHIHSSNHTLETKKGSNTKFATVSILDENYNHVYEPLYFEI